jgi:hypothetical protein
MPTIPRRTMLGIVENLSLGVDQGGATMAQRHQRGWLKKEIRTQGETWVLFYRTRTGRSHVGVTGLHLV